MKSGKDKTDYENLRGKAGMALPAFIIDPSAEWLSRRALTSDKGVSRNDVLELGRQAADAMKVVTVVMLDDRVSQRKALDLLQSALALG